MSQKIASAYDKALKAMAAADKIGDEEVIKYLKKKWNSKWVSEQLGISHLTVLKVMGKHSLKFYREE